MAKKKQVNKVRVAVDIAAAATIVALIVAGQVGKTHSRQEGFKTGCGNGILAVLQQLGLQPNPQGIVDGCEAMSKANAQPQN